MRYAQAYTAAFLKPKMANQALRTTIQFPGRKVIINTAWKDYYNHEPYDEEDMSMVPVRIRSTKNMRLRSG